MGELGRASKVHVHVMVSLWWSRGDGLTDQKIGRILTRAGCVDVVIADVQSIDRVMCTAVGDPAVLSELDGGWQMVETCRAGDSFRIPVLGLDGSIRYLTDRLDVAAVTPEMITACRWRVAEVDPVILGTKDLPELAH